MTPTTPTLQELTHFEGQCIVHHLGENWQGSCRLDDESTIGVNMKWKITLNKVTGQALLQPNTTTWVRGEVTREGTDFQQMDLYGTVEVIPESRALRMYFGSIWRHAKENDTASVGSQIGQTCAQHMSVSQLGENQVMEFEQDFNEADVYCKQSPSLNWVTQHMQDVLLYGQR